MRELTEKQIEQVAGAGDSSDPAPTGDGPGTSGRNPHPTHPPHPIHVRPA